MKATNRTPGIKKLLGVGVSLGVVAVSLSMGFIWARQGDMILPFIAAFTAWWGYLFAHYFETGEFVDGLEGTDHIQKNEKWLVGAALGIAVLVGGMIVGAIGISGEAILTTNIGAVMFLSGYVITHYSVTGHLL